MERIRHRNRKRQREAAAENRDGSLVTRAPARPLLPQTPAAPSPTFPGVPGLPLASPAPASPSCSLGTRTPGYELIQHSCHMGKSQAPHPSHFSSELLTSGYPQLTPLTLFIFPWQQWPRKAHPTPPAPAPSQYKEKKKKSQETKAVLNQQGWLRVCGGPRLVPYLSPHSVSVSRKKQLKKSLSFHIPCPGCKPFPRPILSPPFSL